ncbi:RCC1 domain-containing protein [Sorangium sp. So ce233]|uniref:RCC1 domain-containing protein n=1 Tax=Sorangium sp. So ce233 TaxID=3133290 RepID=UPI003F635C45
MGRATRAAAWRAIACAVAVGACSQRGVVLEAGPGGGAPGEPAVVRVDSLAAGPFHTCGIQEGRLSCWGANDQGQLGVGDTDDRTTPAPIEGDDWAEIVNGELHGCARRLGGSLWCWGANGEGQLGSGADAADPVVTPAFVSIVAPVAQLGSTYLHTCAVDLDRALWCWGDNKEGQLGLDDPFPGDGVDRDRPARVGSANDWTLVDGGQGHSCGIRAPGHLYCWGRNTRGELGLGDEAEGQLRYPHRVGDAEDWIDVRVGQNGSCGLRDAGRGGIEGALYCWGENSFGEAGVGDEEIRRTPTRVGELDDWVSISLDTFHACGVRANGELYCWGHNLEGQLGLGDRSDHTRPVRVGDEADWASVAAGRHHTCARKRDGAVLCAGLNERGQLGTGDLDPRSIFTPVASAP